MKHLIHAKYIEITGIVQGVGFRPFVYRLAKKYGLKGEVLNTSFGVSVFVEGELDQIRLFSKKIQSEAPDHSLIDTIKIKNMNIQGFSDFSITRSQKTPGASSFISPDISICPECCHELLQKDDRRYSYPFINCTNCGPRFTIIEKTPYDRPNTSMKAFTMCKTCQAEYDNPSNRRFHAQPNACEKCGPDIFIYDKKSELIPSEKPIEMITELLKEGSIIAIKGLGGFHIATLAENSVSISLLRKRKKRPEKPFAIMAKNIESISHFASINPHEKQLLISKERPIVLLKKRTGFSWLENIAPNNKYIGVMLPYTPLHFLIMEQQKSALVMTSGNRSGHPIVTHNGDAFKYLSDIADFYLIHNREIYQKCDDSICKIIHRKTTVIRRSRGYTPTPVYLKQNAPHILGCGGELKNTFCLMKNKYAFMSQHIGDLKNLETFNFYKQSISHFQNVLNIHPEIVVHDMHPDYLSSRYAMDQIDVEITAVQHHHAHIVSCMAENGIDGPVIGLAFDGTGFGEDGKIWGGEVLLSDRHSFIREAHLSYIPMPGNNAAVKEPYRMAVSYLFKTFGKTFPHLPLPVFENILKDKTEPLIQIISKKINSPDTSSMGRLFDGVSSIIGLRNFSTYEGQAAMELETVADENVSSYYKFEYTAGEPRIISTQPIIRGIVEDIQNCRKISEISGKFHNTLVHIFLNICNDIRKEKQTNRVVLSGGVFQNSILLKGMVSALEKNNFKVFTHSKIPTGDGGLALGQAVIAASIK